MQLTPITADWDEVDAARQAERHQREHAQYLSRKAAEDYVHPYLIHAFAPPGSANPSGPSGYVWIEARGE